MEDALGFKALWALFECNEFAKKWSSKVSKPFGRSLNTITPTAAPATLRFKALWALFESY